MSIVALGPGVPKDTSSTVHPFFLLGPGEWHSVIQSPTGPKNGPEGVKNEVLRQLQPQYMRVTWGYTMGVETV